MRVKQNVAEFICFSVQMDWIDTLELLLLLSSKVTKAK